MATRTFNFLVDCQIIVGIKDRLLMLKRVNENYNVKITDLEEYRRNRPLIETLKANNLELEKAKKRLFDLEAELFKRQQERSVSNSEFELVNTELKPSIESAELYNLAKELFHHPSKYADMIRNMRERSELQSTPTDRADLTGADLTDANLSDANPTNAKLVIDDNPLSGIKLCNVEADNRIIFQNAKPTSASPSSIATTRPIVKESADRPSIHKITRYISDGKPINQ